MICAVVDGKWKQWFGFLRVVISVFVGCWCGKSGGERGLLCLLSIEFWEKSRMSRGLRKKKKGGWELCEKFDMWAPHVGVEFLWGSLKPVFNPNKF